MRRSWNGERNSSPPGDLASDRVVLNRHPPTSRYIIHYSSKNRNLYSQRYIVISGVALAMAAWPLLLEYHLAARFMRVNTRFNGSCMPLRKDSVFVIFPT